MTVRPVSAMVIVGCLAFALGVPAAPAETARMARHYSASALYNQGNAEARAGRPALAVLNYARARILAPRDADIRANLQAVRTSVGLPAQSGDWFTEHARFASPETVYWSGLVGLALLSGGLLCRRLLPARPALGALSAALGLVVMLSSGVDMLATRSLLHQSVVLNPAVARVSPAAASDSLFTLAPAAFVEVQERHGAFDLIRDDSGHLGWTLHSDLAPIVPAGDAQ